MGTLISKETFPESPMFKKIEEVGNMVQMDKSAIKSTRKGLCKCMPEIEVYLDDLFPKKAKYHIMRLKDNNKADLIIKEYEIMCIKFKKSYIPTLRLLHKYPWIMPKMQLDKGGVKFVLNGADVMCPG